MIPIRHMPFFQRPQGAIGMLLMLDVHLKDVLFLLGSKSR